MLNAAQATEDFVITVVDESKEINVLPSLESELVLVEDEDGMIELVEFLTVPSGRRKRIVQNTAPPRGRYRAAMPTPAEVDEAAETGIFLRSGPRSRSRR